MKKKPGRPEGSTKHSQPKTEKLTLRLSKPAYDFVKSKPRGWLSDLLEKMAKRGTDT